MRFFIAIETFSLLATGAVFLSCWVNTLVCSVLLWSNKCNNNNNAEITPFIPVLAGQNLHMSQTLSHHRQDTWPTNCTPKDTHASVSFYTSGTPHARHNCARFELWGRPFYSSLLASFFLPFGVAMKGIQSTQLHCHISFLSFIQLITCFSSGRGRLLDSRKHRLFWLHIHHTTCCLFEWRTPVGSSEAVVRRFCLLISLHLLWLRVVMPVRIHSLGRIDLFEIY